MTCSCGRNKPKINAPNTSRKITRRINDNNRENQILAQTFGSPKNPVDRKRKIEILKRQGKI